MDKIAYWLKKLGILRSGSFTVKGDAKKMAEMEVKSELYQSNKEINKENIEKPKGDQNNTAPKKNENKIGKIFFWIFIAIGGFFFLAFWGTGWSFWTIVGVLMWGFFLRWIWVHVTSGFLAVGKIIFIGLVIIVCSFIFATPEEDGMGVNVKLEKNETESSKGQSNSDLAKGVDNDTVAEFLLDLKKSTKLDFSKIENDELSWTAERVSLKLQKVKSFTATDLSAKDFDKLQKYFLDSGANTGGIGFTFVPPTGTQSSGFVLKEEKYSGIMCVLMEIKGEGVLIGCGWGPTSNPNSK